MQVLQVTPFFQNKARRVGSSSRTANPEPETIRKLICPGFY
nr:MAG TPA: hypothetical protein [Caudoviricetes sp.]